MKKTVLISSEFLGRGDDGLGRILMGSFLRKLCSADRLPKAIIFYNSGVKLLAHGSEVLDAIEHLEQKGVEISACGTCVNYYQLNKLVESVQIGDMSGMIAELMGSEFVVSV